MTSSSITPSEAPTRLHRSKWIYVGKDGLKVSVAAVKSVDHGAKTVTVKTAEGAEETYHLTDLAVKDTAKGLKTGTKETIYYTEDAGKKIAHFFASN